MGFTLDF
jgi:hypothetical protein